MNPDRWPPLLSAFSAMLKRLLGRLAEALGLAFRAAFLGDLVQLGLGALDLSEGGNVLTRIERAFHELAADADEGAEQREIVDLSGKIAGADDCRARARKLGEISRAADFLHPLVGLEQRLQGDWIGDAVAVGEPQDRFVDAPVQRLEEMMRLELELDVLDQPVVDHQRAEQRGFGLDILREGWMVLLTRTRRYG